MRRRVSFTINVAAVLPSASRIALPQIGTYHRNNDASAFKGGANQLKPTGRNTIAAACWFSQHEELHRDRVSGQAPRYTRPSAEPERLRRGQFDADATPHLRDACVRPDSDCERRSLCWLTRSNFAP
jgi:hypothetical protein